MYDNTAAEKKIALACVLSSGADSSRSDRVTKNKTYLPKISKMHLSKNCQSQNFDGHFVVKIGNHTGLWHIGVLCR